MLRFIIVPTAAAGMAPDNPPIAPMPCIAFGKALVPHRHEQVHCPFSVEPMPGTMLPAPPEPDDGGEAAGGAAAGGGGAAAGGGAAPAPPAPAVPF